MFIALSNSIHNNKFTFSVIQSTTPYFSNTFMNKLLSFCLLFSACVQLYAQRKPLNLKPLVVRCGNDKMVHIFNPLGTVAQRGLDEGEQYYQDFLRNEVKVKAASELQYIVPVVFHVFANNADKLVTQAQCQSALDRANEDFNALNADINSVDALFSSITGKVSVKFVLAQKDPTGKPTIGITYNALKGGFGLTSKDDDIIKAAWDNHKYMNIYLMEDLYNDGVTNNSGVSWYPDINMTNKNTARVVFNYYYLGKTGASVADDEFQSVFTHECGHWLNLRHTFVEGSCEDKDYITDTPPSDVSAAGCQGAVINRCGGIINYENYMDYNATCYKMFTKEQTNRMLAALNHESRKTLWQTKNLIATGIVQSATDPEKPFDIRYSIENHKLITNAESVIISNPNNSVTFTSNKQETDLSSFKSDLYSLKFTKGAEVMTVYLFL